MSVSGLVQVNIRGITFSINCGDGRQRAKWLAMVGVQRYDDLVASEDCARSSCKHVPVGLTDVEGNPLAPTKMLSRLLAQHQGDDTMEVFVQLQGGHHG